MIEISGNQLTSTVDPSLSPPSSALVLSPYSAADASRSFLSYPFHSFPQLSLVFHSGKNLNSDKIEK